MSRARIAIVFGIVAALLLLYFEPLATVARIREALLFARGVRGHTVELSGHRIYYRTAGSGAPIVLIHGLGSSSLDWGAILPDLAKTHRVYALDLLGFGHSDRPEQADYSIAAQSALVRQFADAMHIQRADVIGVSMGGWIAMHYAAAQPQRVRRLVLFDSAGFRFETAMAETTFTPATLAELKPFLALQTDRARYLPDFVGRDFLRHIRRHAPILRASMRAMLTGRDLMDGHTSALTMPALLVWGTADRITPLAVGQRMQRELPNARLVLAKGCGHLAVVECRDQYLPELLRFVR
jgi:pimeloyl-ACP methyl ester carboxylesterase